MKRVFIIHGWGGYPEEGWLPWLKKEIIKKGFRAETPAMPNPDKPEIEKWVSFLRKTISKPDKDTYLVGHSIGCQAILRYLETIKNEKISGVVFVAGFVHLTKEAYEDKEDPIIAKPWLETKINWKEILNHTKKFTAIFSDNDPYVPLTDTKIFEKNLGAKTVIKHNKKHFSSSDGITELPVALTELMKLINKKN